MLVIAQSIATWSDETAFHAALSSLPEHEQRRVARSVNLVDRKRTALGRILLRQALATAYPAHWPRSRDPLLELAYTTHGKPFLPSGPNFNISHSGEYVVCVVDQHQRVGIDVEAVSSKTEFAELASTMTKDQWDDIAQANDPKRRFLEYWTMKESFVKGLGEGLTIDLDKITSEGLSGAMRLTSGKETWWVTPVALESGYVCHVAAKDTLPRISLLTLS